MRGGVFGFQHAAYSFQGSIRVDGTRLMIDSMASSSLYWRPEGATLEFQLAATLFKAGNVLDSKTLDRRIPIITSAETLKTSSYVGIAEFQLPEPDAPLLLKLSGSCLSREDGGRWAVSAGARATGEYQILVEDV